MKFARLMQRKLTRKRSHWHWVFIISSIALLGFVLHIHTIQKNKIGLYFIHTHNTKNKITHEIAFK